MTDPYKDLRLHHETIDWSDTTLTADEVSARLIGLVDYWDRPKDLLDEEEWEFEGLSPLQIERKILFEAKRPNWGGTSRYGKPYYKHFLALIKLLFPDTDIIPSLADSVQFFCIGIGGGRKKILNLIGSANSGKSASSVRIAFAVMFVDPEFTAVYVANPFDNAASSTCWGDVEELWEQLHENFPLRGAVGLEDANALFPHGRKYAERRIDFLPNIPKAASIMLRNVKHTGKLKGAKSRGKDPNRGLILVIIDEVNEIENHAFLGTLSNVAQQDAFFCITSQNFKDPEDLGGRLTNPVAVYGGPDSFEQLEIDSDFYWHSHASSITLRFDGHQSPNILAQRTIYPKLFKLSNLHQMRQDYGETSPKYYEQVRSFPTVGDMQNTVLSRQKISASRHKDDFYSMLQIRETVSFCDPAFGGRDKAMWGVAHFGPAKVTDAEGKETEDELLVFKNHFQALKLESGARFDERWFKRMRDAGVDVSPFPPGAEISFEVQIAIQCWELNQQYGVRPANFGYDFSMRPDIVSAVTQIIGHQAVAFDYNQGPEGAYLQNVKQDSTECCKNRVTELAFLAADYFLSKQVRCADYLETAITQLSRTRYEVVAKKFVAEGKKEYKARWAQVSPDHRDVLMGIAGMAHKRGFRQSRLGRNNSQSVWREINARNIGKSKVVKKL